MKMILLATDGSTGADEAASAAVQLAAETGAGLHVVGVDDSFNHDGLDAVPYETAKAAAAAASDAGVTATAERRVGPAADQIMEAARACDADMIVVGSRGRGWLKGTVFGSVSSALVHRADRPVLVVRSAQRVSVAGSDAAAVVDASDSDPTATTVASDAADATSAAVKRRPLLAVELPGMAPADVKLELRDDSLILRASHVARDGDDATVADRIYARFALPRGTRADDLAATMTDGILSVAVAATPKPSVQVPVSTG